MTPEQLASLQPALEAFLQFWQPCFAREATFDHWRQYLLGLLADLPRKSIEPIALAAGVKVRTLQEVLANFVWDHARANQRLQQHVAATRGPGIGVLDATGHPKQGPKTPGVQRQYCGQSGKIDNCVIAQHLLYYDNQPQNPFGCMLASDLFLPQSWSEDRPRCRQAGIPEELVHRPKWQIGLEQLREALGNGVRFSYVTADEDYGRAPGFWFGLDALGLVGIGEVPGNFYAWTRTPRYSSLHRSWQPSTVEDLTRSSPVFYRQSWQEMTIKNSTRGPIRWQIKWAMVQLPDRADRQHSPGTPTDRRYWLIVARNPRTQEIKYFLSNAPAYASLENLLAGAFGRWSIEQWFGRAKQEAGLGAFEVRTYQSLVRHWLSVRIAMLFLAEQTQRLRGEKSADHVGPGGAADGVAGLAAVEAMARLDAGAALLRLLPTA